MPHCGAFCCGCLSPLFPFLRRISLAQKLLFFTLQKTRSHLTNSFPLWFTLFCHCPWRPVFSLSQLLFCEITFCLSWIWVCPLWTFICVFHKSTLPWSWNKLKVYNFSAWKITLTGNHCAGCLFKNFLAENAGHGLRPRDPYEKPCALALGLGAILAACNYVYHHPTSPVAMRSGLATYLFCANTLPSCGALFYKTCGVFTFILFLFDGNKNILSPFTVTYEIRPDNPQNFSGKSRIPPHGIQNRILPGIPQIRGWIVLNVFRR